VSSLTPPAKANVPRQPKLSGRQLHFWVTERDYQFVASLAAENEDTIAATVRRMIRSVRIMKLAQANGKADSVR
jgi:hypothetical protein